MTGLWCERSGIVNIGIEGMMLGVRRRRVHGLCRPRRRRRAPAGSGRRSSSRRLTGALLAALHAVLVDPFQINQIVSGVVINLFALGLTGFLRSEVIVPSGVTKGVANVDDRDPAAVGDPDRRRDDLHRRPDPLRDVRRRVPHVAGDVPDAVGAARAVVRRAPARRRDASASTSSRIRYQAVILGGAHRRAGRRVVLDGGAGRLRGQHDELGRASSPSPP